jgi:hypothetical protein
MHSKDGGAFQRKHKGPILVLLPVSFNHNAPMQQPTTTTSEEDLEDDTSLVVVVEA